MVTSIGGQNLPCLAWYCNIRPVLDIDIMFHLHVKLRQKCFLEQIWALNQLYVCLPLTLLDPGGGGSLWPPLPLIYLCCHKVRATKATRFQKASFGVCFFKH